MIPDISLYSSSHWVLNEKREFTHSHRLWEQTVFGSKTIAAARNHGSVTSCQACEAKAFRVFQQTTERAEQTSHKVMEREREERERN